jgi:hypothetical protein
MVVFKAPCCGRLRSRSFCNRSAPASPATRFLRVFCHANLSVRGHERRGIRAHELLLLIWCELDHSPLVIGIDAREDLPLESGSQDARTCSLSMVSFILSAMRRKSSGLSLSYCRDYSTLQCVNNVGAQTGFQFRGRSTGRRLFCFIRGVKRVLLQNLAIRSPPKLLVRRTISVFIATRILSLVGRSRDRTRGPEGPLPRVSERVTLVLF